MDMTNFTAGFARLDITPFMGVEMAGSWNARGVQGVLDPLYVNAIAFGDGEKSAVLLVADLVGLRGMERELRPQVAQAAGLSEDAVILHCTHTHTGPNVMADPQYKEFFGRRMCDAAIMALADRKQ